MAAIDKPVVADPFDALLQAYRPARRTTATTEAGPMPLLIPVGDLPPVDFDRLPGAVREFLETGDAADGSKALIATAFALRDQGLTAEQRLSFMWDHDACREVALNHRRQDMDRALEYLWKHHAAKVPDCDPAADFADLVTVAANDAPANDGAGDGGADKAPARRLTFETFAEFTRPDRRVLTWFVPGLVPMAEPGAEIIAAVFGPSGSGKSFFVLHLALCVATGRPFYGRETKPGRVVYGAFEGVTGAALRLRAYAKRYGVKPDDGPHVLTGPLDLRTNDTPREVLAQLRAWGPGGLLILDTLAQVTPGANENDAAEMGAVLARVKALSAATGWTVLLVAHAGKDETRGLRGWSGIKAALDAEVQVIRTSQYRAAQVTKLKDGMGEGDEFRFTVESELIDFDVEAGEVSAGVLVESGSGLRPTRVAPAAKPAKNQGLVLSALRRLSEDRPDVKMEHLIRAVIDLLPPPGDGQRDRRRERAVEAITSLADRGALDTRDGYARLSTEGEDWL